MGKTAPANDFRVYADAVRREMLPFIPSEAKTILDVGCSTGNFGTLLKVERDAEIWGVEVNEEAAQIAAKKLDRVISAPFNNEVDLPANRFDCIIFNDVLEHMVDPYAALTFSRKLLVSGGKIVASIPNVRYFGNVWALLYHKTWEYDDSGILDRTHLRFFTKKSIAAMFTDLDYEVELLVGINPLDRCDPYLLKRFNVLRFLTFDHVEDMRWLQFAVVAGSGLES